MKLLSKLSISKLNELVLQLYFICFALHNLINLIYHTKNVKPLFVNQLITTKWPEMIGSSLFHQKKYEMERP